MLYLRVLYLVIFILLLYVVYLLSEYIMIQNNKNSKIVNFYYMDGCIHCYKLIFEEQTNGRTIYRDLQNFFKNKNVIINKYKYGKDKEADKYDRFPIITINGKEYTGGRNYLDIKNAIL